MIELQNIKRHYGAQNAVDGVDLTIPPRAIFGIIGKSGAGKSTLVRLMSLLERPDDGAVLYGDQRVDNLSKKDLIARRRQIGMIFQNFNLFSSRNAAGNVAYPMEIAGVKRAEVKKRTQELLELVGLKDRGGAAISALSGGQKQRIAIARALANNPSILFCDEATSALDPQTTRSILELIKDLQRQTGITVVMVTHQMEVVRSVCEQVAVIDNGKIVERGKVADIFANPKTAVTKDFLARLTPADADETSSQNLVRWSNEGGLYTLRFRGQKTGEPVLSRLAKKFNIEFNIRAGGVQFVGGEEVGTLLADFSGEAGVIKDAIAYLNECGVTVEKSDNR